jgi:hypothetical protein
VGGTHRTKVAITIELESFVRREGGSVSGVTGYLVVGRGQWCFSVNSARVNQARNRYLEKSRESKQEGCATEQDGWSRIPPPSPHCTYWLKGHETEISTNNNDCKSSMLNYLLTYIACFKQQVEQ